MSMIEDGSGPPRRVPFVRPPAAQPPRPQQPQRSPTNPYYTDAYERILPGSVTLPLSGAGTPHPITPAVDINRPPPGSDIPASAWHHLSPEDRQAIWDEYLRAQQTGTAGAAAAPPNCTNPDLAAFLAQHPDIVTNQDFIEYFWEDKGNTGRSGWDALAAGCAELHLKPSDVTNYRTAAIRDLAYPPPPPDGSLPLTAEEARRYHLVEFTDPTYNPTGPASSVNCGPASLAMALDTQGLMPPGLTPEQRIDYARALMYGTHNQEIEVLGRTVYLLDSDGATTGSGDVLNGAVAAGLTARQESGWAELNTALGAGRPVVASGDCYPAWKRQFPADNGRYGSGEIEHFIAILGRTADGRYIVCDPMFTGGPVEMTRDQLAFFFSKGGDKGDNGDNTPYFVSMDPVKQDPSDREFRLYRYQME
jgi:hypothetical protein